MHSVNIAHCDLKLENVLNFDDIFKIIDLESSIDFKESVSAEVNIKSSLSIMPPELQVYDVAKLSISGDIWSYGMVLYEIMTGDVIVDSTSQEEGYKIVKSFLKDKSVYLDQLTSNIDCQTKNLNSNVAIIVKKSLI